MTMEIFRLGFTGDFLNPAGQIAMGDIGLDALKDTPAVSVEFMAENLPEVSIEQARRYDAIISGGPRYTTRTFEGPSLPLSVVARMGVGYDMVDVEALTARDIILTITPDGIRRPMAGAIVTFLLALAHELLPKDRQVRAGKWRERTNIRTTGLMGRTFGAVGLGNIGLEVLRMIKPFEMLYLGTDPFVKHAQVADLGVDLVNLETLMRRSDFVSIHCPLMPQTRGLIGERELSWMKPTAYFINASRGPIVDQGALYRALRDHKIRGAALDVFDPEPIADDDPLLGLDNVILTPHSLCWTDQCYRGMGASAITSVLAVLRGEIPTHVVNREVLENAGMQAKLRANRARWLDIANG
jgi:phosphoglycerate dehydrogenase-like enzyme